MPAGFRDHHRKRLVRERWDTPTLRWLYQEWGAKYFYFGLPGPEAVDIRLWREMISRVVAFEVEDEKSENPRRNIEELRKNLTLLGIPHYVYCGFLEEVVLEGEDRDEHELFLDEFVTLFNLDFCNRISGRIDTMDGRRCRRFEAFREVITLQRSLFRRMGTGNFIMLITAHDSVHVREMERFMGNPDLPEETGEFVAGALRSRSLPPTGYVNNTDLLKAFLFTCLREYLHGQNVQSVFLPPVSYMGRTNLSPMIHFIVVCSMEAEEEAQVLDRQSARDFLSLNVLYASDEGIRVAEGYGGSQVSILDPVSFLRGFDVV